ncbi:MAG TPA: FtsX-like permease family protein [Planctomycetota bacterium]|nr:FtsX-like permease family protein [Planctomycetota bacterium]
MYRLFLAIRYLLTRPINLLGMGGITISVWALVVVVSLFSGFIEVVEHHVHSATADISVGNLPQKTQWSRLSRALADDPNVAACAPRLLHYGLLQRPGVRPPPQPLPGRGALHGGDQPFLFVLGVDSALEAKVTGFASWVQDAAIPPALRVADPNAPLARLEGKPVVLLGLDRMQREGLRAGDHVVLTTAKLRADAAGNKSPEQVTVDLIVGGAFKTQHGGFDGNNVFVDLAVLRAEVFPEVPDFVHEVAVRVADARTLKETADRLQRSVVRTVGVGTRFVLVQTWREKNQPFLESVGHQRGLLKIVLIVIMVTAAFLMLATLSMMVTEKISDIGILTAMGGTPSGVTLVFLACGLTITLVGVVAGLATGAVTSIYLEEIRQAIRWAFGIDLFPLDVYNLDRVPCRIDPLWLLQVAGMAFATGFVVSAIPALRAARHDPLVSLRGI